MARERCAAQAHKGTGTGICDRPLDGHGYCDRPGDHIQDGPQLNVMAMYLDQHGKPRAWATGPSRQEREVRSRAADLLAAYIEEHGGDPETFTLSVTEMEESA